MNVTTNVASVAGHIPGHIYCEWATFASCPRPCCWPRFWPRCFEGDHVLVTFVTSFGHVQRGRNMARNMAGHTGHVTT